MILVTGGAGFIGRNVVFRLLDEGFKVRVLDDFSVGAALPEHENLKVCVGNVRSRNDMWPASEGAETIIHCACQEMGTSSRKPLRDVGINVGGTVTVLEMARKIGARFVHLSSCSVYGQADDMPITEDAPLRPWTPYAAGKVAGEAYVMAYHAASWVNATILRLSNVYGPGQEPAHHQGVVGKFVHAKIAGKPVKIHGDGTDVRDFTFITDVVNAILLAMDSDEIGPFNISTGIGTRVEDIADMLKLKTVWAPLREIDGVTHRILDPTKAKEHLEWKAKVGLAEGLKAHEAWMREVAPCT